MVFLRVGATPAENDEGMALMVPAETLREIGAFMRKSLRPEDFLARVGRVELVAMLRAEETEAAAMAERVRGLNVQRSQARGSQSNALTAAIVGIPAADAVAPETILIAAYERAREAFKQGNDRVLRASHARFDMLGEEDARSEK